MLATGLPNHVATWDELECDGGASRGIFSEFLDGEVHKVVMGREEAWVTVPRLDPVWQQVREQDVLRIVWPGGVRTEEYRIETLVEEEDKAGRVVGRIEGKGIKFDLKHGGLLERIEAAGAAGGSGGLAQLHYEVYDRTATEIIDIVLGNFGGPFVDVAPTYFTRGTVDPVEKIPTFIFSWDDPYTCLMELAKLTKAELSVRRNGATDYLVDLLYTTNTGGGQDIPYIALEKNLGRLRHERSTVGVANRLTPRGAGSAGEESKIATAAWEIASIASLTLTLQDDAVPIDDMLNGLYAEAADGTRTLITDTIAPNQIVVTSAAAFSPLELVRIKRNAAGDDLTYLEHPISVGPKSAGGLGRVIPGRLDRQDIVALDNEFPDPFFDVWGGGLPSSWGSVGGAIITENASTTYIEFGTRSAKVQADTNAGLVSNTLTVIPSQNRPFFTAQVWMWVEAGAFQIIVEDITDLADIKIWPPDRANTKYATTEVGGWTSLVAEAPENFHKVLLAHQAKDPSITSIKLRIKVLATENGSICYADASQLLNSHTRGDTYASGRGSNALWLAAADQLQLTALPLSQYNADVIDLGRSDPAGFPKDQILMGGEVRLHHGPLGFDVTQRSLSVIESLKVSTATRIEVETELDKLTRLLAATKRRRRQQRKGPPAHVIPPDCPTNLGAKLLPEGLFVTWGKGVNAARTEVRLAGPGATNEDKWNSSPHTFTRTDSEFLVISLDDVASLGLNAQSELIFESITRDGLYSKCWVSILLNIISPIVPCPNFGPVDGTPEICSPSGTGFLVHHTYFTVTLAAVGLIPGVDSLSACAEMKVIPGTGGPAGIQDGDYLAFYDQFSAFRWCLAHRVATADSLFHTLQADSGPFNAFHTANVATMKDTSDNDISGNIKDGVRVFLGSSNTDTDHFGDTGVAALSASDTGADAKFKHFRCWARTTVHVSNLPSGWKAIAVRNAGEFSFHQSPQETESSGTVDIKLQKNCPYSYVEVQNGSGTPQTTITPAGGIWGGDQYFYNQVTGFLEPVTSGFIGEDTFPGSVLDAAKWLVVKGSPSVSGGELSLSPGDEIQFIMNPRDEMVASVYMNRVSAADAEPRVWVMAQSAGLSLVESKVRLTWLDATDTPISSSTSGGISSVGYVAEQIATDLPIPANAVKVRFEAIRDGVDPGQACVRKLQVNQGPACCAFAPPFAGPPAGPPGLINFVDVVSATALGTCAADVGVDVKVDWAVDPAQVPDALYEIDLQYFEERDPVGEPGRMYNVHQELGLVPSANTHTENFGVGNIESKLGTPSSQRGTDGVSPQNKDWSVLLQVRLKGGGVIASLFSTPQVSTNAYDWC